MALQVWLPLNGNIENKGCDNVTITPIGTYLYDDNGKIGKCLNIQSSTNSCAKVSYDNIGTEISICFWVKPNSPGAWSDIIGFGNNSRIEKTTTTQYNYYRAGNELVTNGTPLFILDDLIWSHIVITANGSVVKIYKNGIFQKSVQQANPLSTVFSTNKYFTLGIRTNSTLRYTGYLNDFRIYDHCLSQQEVHEISQGLVLHYPLNSINGKRGNDNLMVDSLEKTMKHPTTSFNGYGITCNPTIGNVTSDIQLTASFYIDNWNQSFAPISSIVLGQQAGNTDTWSCRIYPSSYIQINSKTRKYYGTQTAKNGASNILGTVTRFICEGHPSSELTFTIYNIKLEKGSVATEWCPNSSDALYTTLGYNDSTVYDCSGFGNNLTLNGDIFNLGTSSGRYDNCVSTKTTAWSTSNQPTLTNRVPMRTLSMWFRPNNHASTTISSLGGVWLVRAETYDKTSTGSWVAYNGVNKSNTSNWLNTMDQATNAPGLGVWAHYCWCFDATSYRWYKNGTLLGTYTYSNDARKAIFGTNDAWVYACFTGAWATPTENNLSSYSDFRIYSTALSADDVKLLYQRCASIDNSGKIHCGEVKEDDSQSKQQVLKDTRLLSKNVSEFNIKYDDNIYTEPDGSMWIRIVKQNNPASYIFASTDSFTTNVYKNNGENWFDASLCNYVTTWELMVKQKLTTTSTEQKIRWVQNSNPMTCTYSDVLASKVTYNTTTGYTSSTYGGLFKRGGSTYLAAENGTSGSNWWGAFGPWTRHNNGNPSWNGVVVTTGYSDLYLRIDNVEFTIPNNTKTQFLKEGSIDTNEIIEI